MAALWGEHWGWREFLATWSRSWYLGLRYRLVYQAVTQKGRSIDAHVPHS